MEKTATPVQDKNTGTRLLNNVRIALKAPDTFKLFLNVRVNQPLLIKFLRYYVLLVIVLNILINQQNNVFHVILENNLTL